MGDFNANDWNEDGWRQASDRNDSRYAAKQEAIRQTVSRMVADKKAPEREWESRFESDLTELAGQPVLAGFGYEKRTVGGSKSRAYARGYEIWINSLKEN